VHGPTSAKTRYLSCASPLAVSSYELQLFSNRISDLSRGSRSSHGGFTCTGLPLFSIVSRKQVEISKFACSSFKESRLVIAQRILHIVRVEQTLRPRLSRIVKKLERPKQIGSIRRESSRRQSNVGTFTLETVPCSLTLFQRFNDAEQTLLGSSRL